MSSRVRVNDKWFVLAYYINEANVDQQSQKVWRIDYASKLKTILFQSPCCGRLYYKIPYDHLCNPDLLADRNNPGNATCQVG